MSTSRLGTSVLPGSWRSIAPKSRSISASCARYASKFAALRWRSSNCVRNVTSSCSATLRFGISTRTTKYQTPPTTTATNASATAAMRNGTGQRNLLGEHAELRRAVHALRFRLDDIEARILEEFGAVDIAHERRHARARLRLAAYFDAVARLNHFREVHAFRNRIHDLVEEVYDLGPRALQLVDDAHARKQPLALAVERVDLFDLLVELRDLRFQDVVAATLRARLTLHGELRQVDDAHADDHRADERDEELFLPPLT